MANHRDCDWLLGRRFTADFTVVSTSGEDGDEVSLLRHYEDGTHETFKISFAEFQTAIERGFLTEAAIRPATRH